MHPQYQYPQTYGHVPGPQQPQYTPQSQPGAPMDAFDDPFSDPRGGGSAGPKARNLVGCVVIYQPVAPIDENNRYDEKSAPRPQATVDLVVVSAPTPMITYGDSQDRDVSKQRPATHQIAVPCVFRSVYENGSELVKAFRTAWDDRQSGRSQGVIVGRIVQGTKGNRPYLIEKIPVGDPDRNRAIEIWRAVQSGQFVNPTPVELVQGTGLPMAPQQVPNPYAGYAQAAQQGVTPIQHAAAQPTYTYQATYAQPNAPQSAPPSQANPDAPPGFDPNTWAQLPDAARQSILAQLGQSQGQPGGSPAPQQVQPTY